MNDRTMTIQIKDNASFRRLKPRYKKASPEIMIHMAFSPTNNMINVSGL